MLVREISRTASSPPPPCNKDDEKGPDESIVDGTSKEFAHGGLGGHDGEHGTQRGIKSRQAQMLAIGGTIGTGLFVSTGSALAAIGPAFLFLAFLIVCALVFCILTATNEINAYMPLPGVSMAYYGNRMVSRSLGFAMGWMYWYTWGIGIAYEITAAAVVINYWPNDVNVAVWITIMLVVIVALNFFPVKAYAESEFWFASIKVFTIIGLLILAVILFFGGGPNHSPLYFSLWSQPTPGSATKEFLTTGAAGRFCALLYGMIYSSFSFNFGPELMVITSGEMRAPRKNLPRAATRFIWRLLIFYALGALAIGVICPSDDPALTDGGHGAAASPWVVAIRNAGIHGLDSVINAVIITSAWSSGNSVLYMSSRSLYSMAVAGNAPAVFKRCTKGGVPYYAVLASASFAPLAYLSVGSASSVVFNWLVSVLNTTGFISWVLCCVIFLRFRSACKVQGITKDELPYTSVLQPYGAYVALVAFSIFGLCNGFNVFFPGQWSVSGFFTAYIGLPAFLVIYLGHKIFAGRAEPWIRASSAVDLKTGLADMLASEEAYEAEEKLKAASRDTKEPIWQRPFTALFKVLFE